MSSSDNVLHEYLTKIYKFEIRVPGITDIPFIGTQSPITSFVALPVMSLCGVSYQVMY